MGPDNVILSGYANKLPTEAHSRYTKKLQYICLLLLSAITKTRLFKYIEIFTSKNWTFSDKKSTDIFHISDQNVDCVYSLELPWRGGSNEYP